MSICMISYLHVRSAFQKRETLKERTGVRGNVACCKNQGRLIRQHVSVTNVDPLAVKCYFPYQLQQLGDGRV